MSGLRSTLRSFWKSEVSRLQSTDVSVDDAVALVLCDEALIREAVMFAVEHIKKVSVDKIARGILTKTDQNQLRSGDASMVDELIEHGLSLLDVRFGPKRLGDYFPEQLADYADTQRLGAHTLLIRASFVKAVAAACGQKDIPIREQLSAEQVEDIRARVIRVSPNKDEAEVALAVA